MLRVYNYFSIRHPNNIRQDHVTLCFNKEEFFQKLDIWNKTSMKRDDGTVIVYFENSEKKPESVIRGFVPV